MQTAQAPQISTKTNCGDPSTKHNKLFQPITDKKARTPNSLWRKKEPISRKAGQRSARGVKLWGGHGFQQTDIKILIKWSLRSIKVSYGLILSLSSGLKQPRPAGSVKILLQQLH
ncbi:hypothetical protein F2P79_012064 [Pimephales promelas]|nr:hypothetical protein F2P79_012064 [Pimephales promelas]